MAHEQVRLRRTAVRAVMALRVGAKQRDRDRADERLSRLAERDPQLTVRALACRALGRPTRPLFDGRASHIGRQ
ncbi:hypothetical protein AKJ09_04931 [Labilithrix luteola]|uniref:HEAT repeat domain-containing protein n=1 Tax=Labilithrix luteola TaxID=1391654 RepID=A0A0K1PXN6_9BACT|nr:hypothetical protein AKJ09_04931 [Labilithrix luteola]